MDKIKNREKLLQDIADGLKAVGNMARIGDIEIAFHVGTHAYEFAVSQAIDHLVNEIYWDERGDWSRATKATVYTI